MNTATQSVKVWDPIVRIGHWSLVIAFFTAYLTEEEFMTQHVWAGYVVAGVVAFRIVWGIIGSKHARFSDFIYKPSAVFGYLKNLIQRKPQHYLGHNPAGGAMVIALLIGLSGIAYSGMALLAVEKNDGPLVSWYGSPQLPATVGEAKATHLVNEQDEEFWEELHETFVNFTLLLVALHISGVIFSSYVDKENLIKAMFTGRKDNS